jgi:uncharacterized protein YjiS (DUF1127 family)
MGIPATAWSDARPRLRWEFYRLVLRQTVRAFESWRAVCRAERELHALDDRTLKDIGLTRSEIRSIAREQHGTPHLRPLF